MPEPLEAFVMDILKQARESRRKTGEVQAAAYFANEECNDIDVLPLQLRGADDLQPALRLVRSEAEKMCATNVVLIFEMLRETAAVGTAAKRAQSAGRHKMLPTTKEHLGIRVESATGTWVATPKVVQKTRSESFSDPVFEFLSYSEEAFNSLPAWGSVQ